MAGGGGAVSSDDRPEEQTVASVEPDPEDIDIEIKNVVCTFNVRCHLNLREIAEKGSNVEFRSRNGMVIMKLRHPYSTALIRSSGKITCSGATSEGLAKVAARRCAHCLLQLGFTVQFRDFRIVNVLATCSMPWGIKIFNFTERYMQDACYEPELHPGVTYKLNTPKASLKIFSTGNITVTAASVAFVQTAIEHIFPLVYEFRSMRASSQEKKNPEPLIEEEVCVRRSNRQCMSRYSSNRVGWRRPADSDDGTIYDAVDEDDVIESD